MKLKHILSVATMLCIASANLSAQVDLTTPRDSYSIYVDNLGVMRRSDTKAEVSYYGANYTTPFAHAYRALGYLSVDHKEAIDRDVYHLARLGFNAYRIHIWDVEISDAEGNVINNEHLDLLDYLISRLEARGIDVVITAQTNFGNGYPEKNIDTGAYSYDFAKCDVHDNLSAQKIQTNYLSQLVKHINPYTGKSYADDNAIIALEINNEPCHSGTVKEVTAYINKMVKALKKSGFKKPILYNVSHNLDVTEGYYNANIDGTTYQWYPIGLVAGHERKGNFLPYVDEYFIPWKETMKNYNRLARVVYEFDPGDVLYSYLYPAIARTFRKEGFQWITQFAYDPIDIAQYNTEYQTHYLNLAYTPSKAISMKIAAEVAYNIPREKDFGKYPDNCSFGDFRVNYDEDLSEYNSTDKFFHSNSTTSTPKNIETLTEIAGVGNSPIVDYSGSGAYFLDKLGNGVWRLEVMPDVAMATDPFTKPSLNREAGKIVYTDREMTISLPALGPDFSYHAVNSGNDRKGKATAGKMTVYPGVYLLTANGKNSDNWQAESRFRNMQVGEFVAPTDKPTDNIVLHTPKALAVPGTTITIEAEVFGSVRPDSVVVYPSDISFWREDNRLYPMKHVGNYKWQTEMPIEDWKEDLRYNIVVYEEGKPRTFPQNVAGTPLSWDYTEGEYYQTAIVKPDSEIVLINPSAEFDGTEASSIPDGERYWLRYRNNAPVDNDTYLLTFTPKSDDTKIIVRRNISEIIRSAPGLNDKRQLVVTLSNIEGVESVEIGFAGRNGLTYTTTVKPQEEIRLDLTKLQQSTTYLCPAPFPVFLKREFKADVAMPFVLSDAEFIEIVFSGAIDGNESKASIHGAWLE